VDEAQLSYITQGPPLVSYPANLAANSASLALLPWVDPALHSVPWLKPVLAGYHISGLIPGYQ